MFFCEDTANFLNASFTEEYIPQILTALWPFVVKQYTCNTTSTMPIRAPDQIPDRFYIISMELMSLMHRRLSWQKVPSGKEQGEMAVFAG